MRSTLNRVALRAAVLALAAGALASPSLAQEHPDLFGPWQAVTSGKPLRTIDGAEPPLLPAARAAQQKVMAEYARDKAADPVQDCLPPGIPRIMTQPFPFAIVVGRRTVAMTFEWNHQNRLIYTDRPHFEAIADLFLGQGIGHWEGDTLVIDTNSYNDKTWLDDFGLPHSSAMTTVERIRRVGNQLEDQITITDPKTYSKPWTARLLFRRSNATIKEDYCLGRMNKGRTRSE